MDCPLGCSRTYTPFESVFHVFIIFVLTRIWVTNALSLGHMYALLSIIK